MSEDSKDIAKTKQQRADQTLGHSLLCLLLCLSFKVLPTGMRFQNIIYFALCLISRPCLRSLFIFIKGVRKRPSSDTYKMSVHLDIPDFTVICCLSSLLQKVFGICLMTMTDIRYRNHMKTELP